MLASESIFHPYTKLEQYHVPCMYNKHFPASLWTLWAYLRLLCCTEITLQWYHNGCDGVSNHQPYDTHAFIQGHRKHQIASLAFVRDSPVTFAQWDLIKTFHMLNRLKYYKNIYSYFDSCLGFGPAHVDEINSETTIHVVCPSLPIPCLLMLWWC